MFVALWIVKKKKTHIAWLTVVILNENCYDIVDESHGRKSKDDEHMIKYAHVNLKMVV
jgi:hypothetical protein